MLELMAVADINLNALQHNLERVKHYLNHKTRILVAVKADAYGHGAIQVARFLEQQGVDYFGVATAAEALELRQGGVNGNILIFSPEYHNLEALLEADVQLSVVNEASLIAAERAAQKLGRSVAVHLKADTGMGRLGQPWPEAAALAQHIDRSKQLELRGVWTHFAQADEAERDYTNMQLSAFHRLLSELKYAHIDVPLVHSANSSAVIAYPEAHFDMVRPGIMIYGYHSSPFIAELETELQPVMTLHASVTFVKRFKQGQSLSYSSSWTAPQDCTIATVRIGYADGYPRCLGNRAEVWLRHARRPIRGRVCMDQLMVDVGDDEVSVGDEVQLFGGKAPCAEEIGQLAGSISYEVLTGIGRRVQRVYRES